VIRTLLLLLFIFELLFAGNSFAGTEIMTLLTEEEGAMKDAPSGLFEVGRKLNDGPDIEIVTPQMNNEYKSPVRIIVLFVPQEGREVDLSKLRVECLKFFTINLTDRVRPYTTTEGIKIDKAKLPEGEHKIRVTIGDKEGGITQVTFVVKVI
jgi:hypothetical protein